MLTHIIIMFILISLTVDRDVENIQPLSKADMLQFYEEAIVPSSSYRAKLSVQMVGQATPLPTSSLDQALGIMAQFLRAREVPLDEEMLVSRFQSANLMNGNMADAIGVMKTYLIEDARINENEVDEILGEGVAYMQAEAVKENTEDISVPGEATDNNEESSKITKSQIPPLLISDAHEWKASLTATAAPQAVKDLSEFEESEPKL